MVERRWQNRTQRDALAGVLMGSCVVNVDEVPCGAESMSNAPFPICLDHSVEVYRAVLDAVHDPGRYCVADETPEVVLEDDRGVVYYVRVGELIKIGTTTRAVHERIQMLPPDRQILATEPGGRNLERARHEQFRKLRVYVNREWFNPSPELWQHIAIIRAEHGEPADLGAA